MTWTRYPAREWTQLSILRDCVTNYSVTGIILPYEISTFIHELHLPQKLKNLILCYTFFLYGLQDLFRDIRKGLS